MFNLNCYVFFFVENWNGDICVLDIVFLVVLDKIGKFRFRYYGKVFDIFDKFFLLRGVFIDF